MSNSAATRAAIFGAVIGMGVIGGAAAEVSDTDIEAGAAEDQTDQPGSTTGERINQLDGIVVTAQRRGQSLQDVPIAVTAITSEDLAAQGLTTSTSLEAAVPSLTMPQSGTVATPFLRGIGSQSANPNDEPSVATYIDGIYVASPLGNMYSFNNIERIEVLKGPQGTLFGRNATGGVIQLVTRDPEHDFWGTAEVGYGNYDTSMGSAYITGGITENLAADLSVFYRNQSEGFGINIETGNETHKERQSSLRSKWLYTPTESTELRLSLDYTSLNDTAIEKAILPGFIARDGSTYPGRHNINSDIDPSQNLTSKGASVRWDQDLGLARLVSISAYREVEGWYNFDIDITPLQFASAAHDQSARNFSQEVQLLSQEGSVLDWIVGVYYFDAKYAYAPQRISGIAMGGPDQFSDLFSEQSTESYSIYGQGTYGLSDRLNATLGVRYTSEQQEVSAHRVSSSGQVGAIGSQRTKVDEPTWRTSLDYKLGDRSTIYASYTRGMKSGGFNLVVPSDAAYDPEILDAYEIGVKNEFLDRRLRLNASAFYYDYKDIQLQLSTGLTSHTANAAAAEIKGADVEFTASVTGNLTISGGFGWLDSKYTDYANAPTYTYPGNRAPGTLVVIDATGNRTNFAPKRTANLVARYAIPTNIGEFSLNGSAYHNSGYYVSPSNETAIDAHTLVNASLDWRSPDQAYGLRLWVNNLTDRNYFDALIESAQGPNGKEVNPRMYGVSFMYNF